jgi:protein-S-isoprenylcysteine O-methyltransferase Ste14
MHKEPAVIALRALEHKIPPPLVGLALALAMWGTGPALDWAAVGAVRRVLALALLATGLGFDAAGLLAFYRAKTTVNPLQPGKASALVATGVYRVTRNPMYVGMALLLSAWALTLGTLPMLAGPVGFVLFITRFQIIPEERFMAAKFGEAYAAYCRRVRRWL